MVRRLHRIAITFCICFLIGSTLLACDLSNGPSDVDLMEGAVPRPNTIPETIQMEYIAEDGTSIATEAIEGWVIVKFNLTTSQNIAENLILNSGGEIIAKIPSIRHYLAEVASGTEMDFINNMRQSPNVIYAMPDVPVESFRIEPNEWENKSDWFSWHLREINADLAWGLVDDLVLSENEIAIIDGNFNGVDDGLLDFEGRIVGSIPSQLPWPASEEGHGTTVAAVAAATGDNGFGNVGVNWKSKIIFQRTILLSDLYFAILNAVSNGADVISISKGFDTCLKMRYMWLPVLFSSLNDILTLNDTFLVVQAAGNDGCEITPTPITPNKPDNLILVGATNYDGGRYVESNYGSSIDVAAPGFMEILHYSTGGLETEGGTSFSAPLVSGAAALVWSKEPDLTPQELIQRLKDTAQPFANLQDQYEDKFGAGILYVYAALGGTYYSPEDPVVTFPDPNLEAAVREAIGKPTGPIYRSDLEDLTGLRAGDRNIVDLTGLEHATNLTWL